MALLCLSENSVSSHTPRHFLQEGELEKDLSVQYLQDMLREQCLTSAIATLPEAPLFRAQPT